MSALEKNKSRKQVSISNNEDISFEQELGKDFAYLDQVANIIEEENNNEIVNFYETILASPLGPLGKELKEIIYRKDYIINQIHKLINSKSNPKLIVISKMMLSFFEFVTKLEELGLYRNFLDKYATRTEDFNNIKKLFTVPSIDSRDEKLPFNVWVLSILLSIDKIKKDIAIYVLNNAFIQEHTSLYRIKTTEEVYNYAMDSLNIEEYANSETPEYYIKAVLSSSNETSDKDLRLEVFSKLRALIFKDKEFIYKELLNTKTIELILLKLLDLKKEIGDEINNLIKKFEEEIQILKIAVPLAESIMPDEYELSKIDNIKIAILEAKDKIKIEFEGVLPSDNDLDNLLLRLEKVFILIDKIKIADPYFEEGYKMACVDFFYEFGEDFYNLKINLDSLTDFENQLKNKLLIDSQISINLLAPDEEDEPKLNIEGLKNSFLNIQNLLISNSNLVPEGFKWDTFKKICENIIAIYKEFSKKHSLLKGNKKFYDDFYDLFENFNIENINDGQLKITENLLAILNFLN